MGSIGSRETTEKIGRKRKGKEKKMGGPEGDLVEEV